MAFQTISYVLHRRKIVLWVTAAFILIGLIAAILTKSNYESRALLMPPLEEGGEGMLAAWMAQLNLPSMVSPMAAGTATAAILADILQSRSLAEMIINSRGLMEHYEVGTMDDAVYQLSSRTAISNSATGLITLRVWDEDPELAEIIARTYISGLDSLNRRLRFSRAEQTMEFISGQISRYAIRLKELRGEMARFQRESGVIDFEEQVRGAIDVAASLKVRTIVAKIELDLLKEFARRDATELRRKEAEYRQLTEQLGMIMTGDTTAAVFMPLGALPDLYQRYAMMQRDLEANERVYSYLKERYEESGIERARTTPSVQVVDRPNIPQKPSGLPRWSIILIVGLIGFLWIIAILAWWGWMSTRQLTTDENRAFEDIISVVRGDLQKLRRFLRL